MGHIILRIQEDIAEVQEEMESFFLLSQTYLCFTSANHPLEHCFYNIPNFMVASKGMEFFELLQSKATIFLTFSSAT